MKTLIHCSCLLVVLALGFHVASAQIPRTLSYQGMLTDSLGTPKPDGDYTLSFRLYEQETGGSAIWTESKVVEVKRGLFSTLLADEVPFDPTVRFDRPYWLTLQVGSESELTPRLPLSAVAYSMNSLAADSSRIAGTVPNGSITSAKIQNGTIQLADLAQNGASDGQVLKWTSGAWTVAADATGGGGASGGWTDGGAVVGLTTAADTVSINSTSHMGKLNVGGNIGLNSNSRVYFGTAASHLGGLGNNLFAQAEGFTFNREGESGWMRVDNATKEVGIGTVDMNDRLHVKNDAAAPCWMRVETSNATSWGQAGLRIKTPQNMWNLRMDNSTNANIPNGGLSLYSQDGGVEAMTWLENGKVGVGTKNPARKFHVNGSAEVEDTLYAGTVNAGKFVGGSGVAHGKQVGSRNFAATWIDFDSVTIQIPGPGYVLFFFTGVLESDHDYGDVTYVHLQISTSRNGGTLLDYVSWALDRMSPSGTYMIPVSVHAIVPVAFTGAHEYFIGGLNGSHDATHDLVKLSQGSFSVLFIPTSYGTVEFASNADIPTNTMPAQERKLETGSDSFQSQLEALKLEVAALKSKLSSPEK